MRRLLPEDGRAVEVRVVAPRGGEVVVRRRVAEREVRGDGVALELGVVVIVVLQGRGVVVDGRVDEGGHGGRRRAAGRERARSNEVAIWRTRRAR
eukprot:29403-Pelagococcus_subviridis.AAC.5